jgi:hypothetical protein
MHSDEDLGADGVDLSRNGAEDARLLAVECRCVAEGIGLEAVVRIAIGEDDQDGLAPERIGAGICMQDRAVSRKMSSSWVAIRTALLRSRSV